MTGVARRRSDHASIGEKPFGAANTRCFVVDLRGEGPSPTTPAEGGVRLPLGDPLA